jgi:hypothetical protein
MRVKSSDAQTTLNKGMHPTPRHGVSHGSRTGHGRGRAFGCSTLIFRNERKTCRH